jgi:hypothetical protein
MSTRPTQTNLRFYKPRHDNKIFFSPLASRNQKGKRRSSVKGRSLIIIVFLILATGCFFITVGGSLHRRKIDNGKRGEKVIIKRRHWKRKLVKLVDALLLILAPLVAQEHVLALTSVTASSKHTLEYPKDTTRGGRGRSRWRSSCAGMSGQRSS